LVLPVDGKVPLSWVRSAPAGFLRDHPPAPPPPLARVSTGRSRRPGTRLDEGPAKTAAGSLEVGPGHGRRPSPVRDSVVVVNCRGIEAAGLDQAHPSRRPKDSVANPRSRG